MAKIIPQGKFILVGEEKKTTTTSAGIILDGVSLSNTKIFSVVDVGPDVTNITAGDRVILKLNDALPIDIDGVQRLLAPAENVLATVKFERDPTTYLLNARFSQESLEDISAMINRGI